MGLFTSNHYLLLLDNDHITGNVVEVSLGMDVFQCNNLQMFDNHLKEGGVPFAILLDTHLATYGEGTAAIPAIRAQFLDIPIIVLTADDGHEHLSEVLLLGADDVLYKPFWPTELKVRIFARRSQRQIMMRNNYLTYADVKLNLINNQLSGPLGATFITPVEARILAHLFSSEDYLLSISEISARAWQNTNISRDSFYRKIHECRKNIRRVSDTIEIETSYGKGFRAVRKK